MKTFKTILSFLTIILVSSFLLVDTPNSTTINGQLSTLNSEFPHEKIYLHFDKPYYSEGDTIWFKSYYHVSSQDYLGIPNTMMYVDLIDANNDVLQTKRLNIGNYGAAGEFPLPNGTSGTFQVRAYTNSMRNHDQKFYFKKEVSVLGFGQKSETLLKTDGNKKREVGTITSVANFDMQFFPEGGTMVNGLSSYLGFKSINQLGMGIDVEGEIFDYAGKSYGSFKSFHRGIGGVTFKPESGKAYYAMVRSPGFGEKRFELPAAMDEGVTLKIVRTVGHLLISGQASEGVSNEGSVIIGQINGKIIFFIGAKDNNPTFYGRIPLDVVPDGVLQITLFDRNLNPRCERLVFVSEVQNNPILSLKPDKENYGSREKVELELDMKLLDQPATGEVSLSITDETFVKPIEDSNGNIYTYMLLTSNLKGNIENPNYYFEDDDPVRKKALDHLMLTQGWRRFEWDDLINNRLPIKKHLPESGITLSGTLRKLDTNKPVEGLVSVVTSDPFSFSELETDSLGRFLFYGWEAYDSSNFVLQGAIKKIRKKGKKEKLNKYVKVKLDKWKLPEVERDIVSSKIKETNQEADSIFEAYLRQSVKIQNIERSYNPDRIYLLEGVSVSATMMGISQDPFTMIGKIYGEPDNRIVLDSLTAVSSFPTVMDIIRGRVAGVDVRGDFPNYSISIRGTNSINGSNEPLFVVDGVPTTMDVALVINTADVYLIDVLKNQGAAMYGTRAANGVIAIYTRRGLGLANTSDTPGIAYVKVPGFSKPRVFYTPKYDVEKPEHAKPDYRTTLYWNPTVEIDDQGKGKVSFYTSDSKSNFRIEVQGMTQDGQPVVSTARLSTKQ